MLGCNRKGCKVVDVYDTLPKIRLQHSPHILQAIHDQLMMQNAAWPNIQCTHAALQNDYCEHPSSHKLHKLTIALGCEVTSSWCQTGSQYTTAQLSCLKPDQITHVHSLLIVLQGAVLLTVAQVYGEVLFVICWILFGMKQHPQQVVLRAKQVRMEQVESV